MLVCSIFFSFIFGFLLSFNGSLPKTLCEGRLWLDASNTFMFLLPLFAWHFPSHIDSTLRRKWTVPQSAIFPYSHTLASLYNWHGGYLKVPQLLFFSFWKNGKSSVLLIKNTPPPPQKKTPDLKFSQVSNTFFNNLIVEILSYNVWEQGWYPVLIRHQPWIIP